MTRKYFGTDGIRGRVGEGAMTPEFMMRLGYAVGRVVAPDGGKIVIGKDTRISGYMIESALEAGLSSAGVDIRLVGPMPTPGIAYLTRAFRASAGIVISASHNPYYDNGIKFFSPDGAKLTDEQERAIEAELEKPMQCVDSAKLGKAKRIEDAGGRYIEFCKSSVPGRISLKGLHIVLDCAHGAAYHVGPRVFHELGAKVTVIGAEPDGLNINEGVGSTHTDFLAKAVLEHGADLGIALDGDADRVMMVDSKGDVLDGDDLLYIITCSRRANGKLKGPVVGTVMSNLGLELAMKAMDIPFLRGNVGDRYVMELLHKHGGKLGGETSGHILCLDRTTTGDGIISALQVLTMVVDSGKDLVELRSKLEKCPQVLLNVRVAERFNPMEKASVVEAVNAVETRMNGTGRVLLRASGTEPLIRVMVEGQDAKAVQAAAEELVEVVKAAV